MIFRPRYENELVQLPAESIIEYAIAARDAGYPQEFERAIRITVYILRPRIEALVSFKITDPTDRDQVVGEVTIDAIRSAATISGSHVGEVYNWIKTIARRRIADFYGRPKSRTRQVPIGPAGDGDRPDGVEPVDDEQPQQAVLIEVVIEKLLESRSPAHVEVIRRRRRGEPSRGIAEALGGAGGGDGMTAANVDQIFSRFRKELAEDLGAANA